MKKALIILLTLALAGGLFAQDISFSGHVQTGMFIDILDADDDVHVRADDDDVGAPIVGRFNIEVDEGDWGAQIGTGADIGSTTGKGMFMYNAHGWLKFADMVTVRAGLIDPGVWTTGGEYDDNVSSGGGLRVEITPIDGLNLGAFFSYPDGGDYAGKIGNFFGETAFGFEYKADIFRVAAAMKLFSEESTYPTGKDTDMKLIFGASFTGIPALTLELSGGIEHLGDYSDSGVFTVYEEGKFAVTDALTVGLLLGEGLTGPDGFCFFKVKPYVEFAVNDAFSVGADVGVTLGEWTDDMSLATIFADIWGKYKIGGGWMQAGYGFENKTKDFGDALDHYIKLVFGWDF